MAGKEAVDAIEKSLDVIEKNLDRIEDPVAYIADQRASLILGGVAIGMGLGLAVGTIGYILAKKRIQAKYEEILEQERLEMKDYYAKFYKEDDFKTPGDAVKSLGREADVALTNYQGMGEKVSRLSEVEEELIVEEETEVEVTPTTKNIFTENKSDEVWDQDQEDSKRASNPDDPYVITLDEFQDNEHDYEQITLTYFSEDDVLVDQNEKPIESIDGVVGEGNLLRFGHGSKDNRIVYIRNNSLSYDFEVVKKDGSYARDILGFQHSDGGSRKVRKFRGVDE